MSEDASTMIGVVGQQWRATVSSWGAVRGPWKSQLDWYVAADDRWHDPADNAAVRQRRIDGVPVLETRMRIPDGDAVQRTWAVADRGGVVVVEFENDSPLPMAIALVGAPIVTSRPASDVPIQGIDLPDDSILLPVGHRSTVRVLLPQAADLTPEPAGMPDAATVARGWRRVVDAAGRLELPDPTLAEAVVGARADLLLEGPVEPSDDPLGFLLDVGEMVRMGDDADAWLPHMAATAERVARLAEPDVDRALVAVARVAAAADDPRAVADVERLRHRRAQSAAGAPAPPASFALLRRGRSVGRFVADVEGRLVSEGRVLPGGLPTAWLGANFEVHGLPSGIHSDLSFAVRWHGERPAVLWEQHGSPVELRAPDIDADWSSSESSGEALWKAPRGRTPLAVSTED